MRTGSEGSKGSKGPKGSAGSVSLSAAAPNLILRRRTPGSSPFTPDETQSRVIAHRGSPLAIYGAPGTGKTRTLIEAVLARVNEGVDPNSILILTYGRDRASELRDEIAIRAGSTSFEPLSRTFHSLAFSIINEKLEPDDRPYILVSGAEQDAFIKELLQSEHSPIAWHPDLAEAVKTDGFVREVRDLISRAIELNLTPKELIDLGKKLQMPYWESVAKFWADYHNTKILRDQSVSHGPQRIDTAENVFLAIQVLRTSPEIRGRFRSRYTTIIVDEFQESDNAQRALLQELAQDDLVIFCDPDSAVGRFRGADPDGVVEWLDAHTATREIFTKTWRGTDAINGLVGSVAERFRTHSPSRTPSASRANSAEKPPLHEGIELHQFTSHGESAHHIAQVMRRAHLVDGIPWSAMAVIVRTPGEQVSAITRAFASHHIPLAIDAEALALADNPAVRPFLLAAQFAIHPERLTEENWESIEYLLLSELCGADALQLRAIRAHLLAAREEDDERSTTQMMLDIIKEPVTLDVDDSLVIPLVRLRDLLAAAKKSRNESSELLWSLWSNAVNYQGESIPELWRKRALKGGTKGASADRDLDSAIQLFEAARRFSDRMQGAKPEQFLEQIMGERLQSDAISFSAQREEVVSLLTVHSAKGREWEIVAIPSIQEGEWPNLKARGSLLGSEILVDSLRTGLESRQLLTASTSAALVEDERRLLYVALSRAQKRLIITAISAEEEQPSRYFEELHELLYGGTDAEPEFTESTRSLTEQALVATLRAELATVDLTSPRAHFLSSLLATLAEGGVRSADPKNWLGALAPSTDAPLFSQEESVKISPSGIQSFIDCELKWFLEKSGAQDGDSSAQLLGTAIHGLAARTFRDSDFTAEQAKADLAKYWKLLGTNIGWAKHAEQAKAFEMIERFFEWAATNERSIISVEQPFSYVEGRAKISGSIDRLELSADGESLFVVDIKTGSPVTKDQAEEHRQLKAYQLAVEKGAWIEESDGDNAENPIAIPPITTPGGAELLFLKKDQGGASIPQSPLDSAAFIQELHEVAEGMSGASFKARLNEGCRTCKLTNLCPLQSSGKSVIEP